jgi:hypothetical protein
MEEADSEPFGSQEGVLMFAKHLAAGLMIGAGLLVGAATVRADDTIVLKRVKNDAAAQNLPRDVRDAETLDTGGRGGFHGHGGHFYGGHRGFYGGYRGFYGGYRGFYGFGYYPGSYGYGGLYGYQPYYYPSYYYPSYYSYPSISVSTYYPISGSSSGSSVSTLKLGTQTGTAISPARSEDLPAPRQGESLPPPRLERPGDRTFPYDGAPQVPVPMPRPDPELKAKPPANAPDDGKVVSLPARERFTYPAYGDMPIRAGVSQDRPVVIKDDGKKPGR